MPAPSASAADPLTADIKPADLRGILKYVPLWRDHVFVIALDGSIVEDDNFPNLLLDLAVLRSLAIKVVLVHGIGQQLTEAAAAAGVTLSDVHGEGRTDEATLSLAVRVNGLVSHAIMQGLTQTGLRVAITNAVRSTEIGVLHGEDQEHSGKVEKIDAPMLKQLLDREIIPLVSPVLFNREGRPLRVNSDLLASALARELGASKLIYLTPHPGLVVRGEFVINVPVEQVREILEKEPQAIATAVRSKARHAVTTIDAGTPRVHIIDGRVNDGLLTEIFSKVGIGTMIHGNEYERIRPARKKDVPALYGITKAAVKAEALRYRSQQNLEREIDHFYVYEIDGSIIGCVSMIPYPGTGIAEVAAVYVQAFYQGKGVGQKLVDYVLMEAKQQGFAKVIALSTQSYPFFRQICEFEEGTIEDLPESRREALQKSRRNSRILVKAL